MRRDHEQPIQERSHQLFTLSAQSEGAVQKAADNLRRHLGWEPDQALGDLAYTQHVGQREFAHRIAIAAGDREELLELCQLAAQGEAQTVRQIGLSTPHMLHDPQHIAFLFTGQGSQYSGMGQDLYRSASVFRAALDECAEILASELSIPLLDVLFDERHAELIHETHITQPALMALEYALAKLWMSWGIQPRVLIGHSVGEFTAACLAGAFSLEDGLRLVAARGRLMQELCPRGAMMMVARSAEEVRADLALHGEAVGEISIAVINSEQQVVVAGEEAAILRLADVWSSAGVFFKKLSVSHAFHSHLMEPMLDAFHKRAREVVMHPLQIPIVSNLEGRVLEAGHVYQAEDWCRHLRETVRFGEGLQTLVERGVCALVEIGPQPVLRRFADRKVRSEQVVVHSLKRGEPEWRELLSQLGSLWARGVEVEWAAFDADYDRRRVHVPTYPFERKSYWLQDRQTVTPPAQGVGSQAVLPQADVANTTGEAKVSKGLETSLQQLLARFWHEVLGIEGIGIDSHFFDLGGDSLNMIQLQSRIRDALGLTVEFPDFFAHPTLAQLAAHLEGVQARSRAQVEEPTGQVVPRTPRRDGYEVSYTQRRMWFQHQLAQGSTAYHIPVAVELTGRLDLDALKQSVQAVVARHESLRTAFVQVDERPMQVIAPDVQVPFQTLNLSALPEQQRESALRQVVQQQVQRAFDLEKAPLLRLALVQLAEERATLVLVVHHIVWDGWSFGVFVREMLEHYQAHVEGRSAQLPELAIQYVDYAEWHTKWLQRDGIEGQLRYWEQQLAGPLPVLQLPTDRPRPAVQSYRGGEQHVFFDKEVTRRLEEFARREGATMFMTLLAAFQTLLYRYTGQEDVIVGTPVAGRHHQGTEGLIGAFVNTIALRTDLSGTPTFRELLSRVRDVALAAYAHQDVPFEMLLERLQVERQASYPPIFQAMFVLQNTAPLPAWEVKGLQMQAIELASGAAKFDLELQMTETAQGLVGKLEYNCDLFDAETMERLLGHFSMLVHGVLAAPETCLLELPLLTEAERQQILIEWNQTDAPYPQDVTLVDLLAQQVERTPERIALVYGDRELTYRELDGRANRFARQLQARGVGPDQRVGVCMERSVEMVVALLGVLKAGGGYVPIDPAYPAERIAYLLQDAGVSAVVTQEHLQGLVRESGVTICLDERDAFAADAAAFANVSCAARPEHIAYMIYTSGSTGQPKGVLNEHRGIVNRLLWMQEQYELTERDRVLQKTPYSFDVSVWEFFWPLITGACLVVAKPEGHRDPRYLVEEIQGQGITALHFVPSMLQVFLEEPSAVQCASVRQVICSGEALPFELQERFFERMPQQVKLHNLYGPTEAAVDVTYWECQPTSPLGFVPIGRPVANTQLYILDALGQPVPIGVTGELQIAGVQVARGYHGRPDLTAEKFVADPFAVQPDARMYKTGDLARYLADGTIQYLGRIDHQVKLRGLRIELGEIEEVLGQHPAIRQAVVQVHQDDVGHQRLVAYAVAENELTSRAMREFLLNRVPEFMVPSALILLEELPLSPNGKVDRRLLPVPHPEAFAQGQEFVAPRNRIEEVLAESFEHALAVERVGIDDNYFELGGDSIRSLQVIAYAKEREVSLSLADLFQHQTIRELAAVVQAQEQAVFSPVEPFSLLQEEDLLRLPAGLDDAYPLTKLQEGMLFHSQFRPESSIYHDVMSLHLRAPFDAEALEEAVRMMVRRHDLLRTSFAPIGFREPVQMVHREAKVPLTIEDWRHLTGDEQRRAREAFFAEETKRHFDWTEAPLMRFHVHRWTEGTMQFTFTKHHVIADGWSVASLLTELFQTYAALHQGDAIPAYLQEPLSATFHEYVAVEREALGDDGQRRYWQELLYDATLTRVRSWPQEQRSGEVVASDLPTLMQSFEVTVSDELLRGVHALANRARVPLKSALLAAHLKVISALSGQPDVVTGVVVNGRLEAPDAERVFGLHLNSLPLRLQLTGGTWEELVQDAFLQERQALPARRYPLAQIQRDAGGQELFETFFNYINFHVYDAIQGVPGMEVLEERDFLYTNFPLAVEFNLMPDGKLTLRLNYNSETYGTEQMQVVANGFLQTLQGMASQPDGRYEELRLLTEAEERQMLGDWNDTFRVYPQDVCLHELVERQVEQTPDAVAVRYEEIAITYRELNRRADRLAQRLQQFGVETGHLVGVCLERSVEMVVALLGVLKAGAAYVPIDPTLPSERIAYLVEDAQACVVLLQDRHRERLPVRAGVELIELGDSAEASWSDGMPVFATKPQRAVCPEDPAYMIYTSGSTGQPKGVLNSHLGIVNRLLWMQEQYELTAHDRVLQKTPYGFDVSVWEFFWPLITGATLVIAKPEGHRDSRYLVTLIQEAGITTLHFVPSMLQVFLEESGVELSASVRQVFCSGEALPHELQERFFARMPAGTRLHNLYGPTEAAVDVTYWECRPDCALPFVPIGRPVANTQLYILDRHLQPVPIGVPGELHIGGVQVALGYWGKPELTAEKFIPDPFASQPDARMYKTGDLACYLPDGNIQYLGRLDDQVKIRGQRVELGEIEAVMAQHPAVREALVLAREVVPGDLRLVAYATTVEEGALTEVELYQYGKTRLPEHMVPVAYTILTAFPLTPNGKVDRKALPVPDGLVGTATEYVAPETPTQEWVAKLWAELLQVDRVGARDHFFELGGHSLLATKLLSQLRLDTGVELPISALFEAPTLAVFAERIDQQREAVATVTSESGSDVPMKRLSRQAHARRQK